MTSSPRTMNKHSRIAVLLLLGLICVFHPLTARASQWYKAALHQHTSWSDGQQLPELVANWYKNNGYNFFVFTDHNSVANGTSWKQIGTLYAPTASVTAAAAQFGSDWNVTREVTSGTTTVTQLKLKTFDEIKTKLDEAGKFLTVQGEEITSTLNGSYIHANAWNTPSVISAATGTTALEILNKNLASVVAKAAGTNRTILAQINHPNAGPNASYAISAEDLAKSTSQFVEIYNAVPNTYHYGDSTHPSEEKLWDIANTIRLTAMHMPPLYGTAVDDAHTYLTTSKSAANPGRAWTMIRASELSTDAIFTAMTNGDFYASTGVELSELNYDSDLKTLTVSVNAESNVNYRIDFIGTLKGVDPTKQTDGTYSSEIGKVLYSVTGTSATYTLTGNELYVRAFVYSDKAVDYPTTGGVATKQAWTQPVGWSITTIPEPCTCMMLITAAFGLLAYLWRNRP